MEKWWLTGKTNLTLFLALRLETFSFSSQLLIKSKLIKKMIYFLLKHSGDAFIPLLNFIRPTTVGIITFMSVINVMLK